MHRIVATEAPSESEAETEESRKRQRVETLPTDVVSPATSRRIILPPKSSKFPQASVIPEYLGETQFDAYLQSPESDIPCATLNPEDGQESFLLQRCPCDYVWNGTSFARSQTQEDRRRDYTYTRFIAPAVGSETKAVGCIPMSDALAFAQRPGGIEFGKTRTYLTKNATLYEKLPVLRSWLGRYAERRSSLMSEEATAISQSDAPPWLNVTPESQEWGAYQAMAKYLNTLAKFDRALDVSLESWAAYVEDAKKVLAEYGLAEDDVAEAALGFTSADLAPSLYKPNNLPEVRRIKRDLEQRGRKMTDDEVKEWMLQENVKRMEEAKKALASAPVISKHQKTLNDIKETVESSLKRIEDVIDEETEKIASVRKGLMQSIEADRLLFAKDTERSIAAAIHEFEMVNRFHVENSAYSSGMVGDLYPNPALVPVKMLTSVTEFDFPATSDYWDRWILQQYSVDNKEKETVEGFLKSGRAIRSPQQKIPLPNYQFLSMIKEGLDTKALSRGDLALAELAHEFGVWSPPIPSDKMNLLPPHVRSIVTEYFNIVEQQQNLLQQQERLQENIRFLVAQKIVRENIDRVSDDRIVDLLTTPQVADPRYPNETFTSFDTKEDAINFLFDMRYGQETTTIASLENVIANLLPALEASQKRVQQIAEKDLSEYVKRIRYAITSYLSSKRWPSRDTITKFAT